MAEPICAVQYGLGPIGSAVARHVVKRPGVELVGGVEIDPAKVGQDIGRVIGLDRSLGIVVTRHLSETLARCEADVVLHTTSSHFDSFKSQIVEILEAGLDVVSTAEELSFPWLAHRDTAMEIDAVARRTGHTVLGTGVNPGFIMDSLPVYLTAICQQVDHISVTRVINASRRRGPFQAKIGAGLTVDEFEARVASGAMGHVGLPESMGMVFDTLGRSLDRYESTIEPLVAERPIRTEFFEVAPGEVRGVKQLARGYTAEGEFMQLEFVAALEADADGDTIRIAGQPNLEVRLEGTNGDLATVAIAVNALPHVLDAAAGLVTMRDLPPVSFWSP